MLKHYNITVKGKVQGVWFRKSTHLKASELHIKGYVKNQPDGSVYIESEGNQKQLEKLLQWCSEGPEFAMVEAVNFEEAPIQSFTNFEILY